MTRPDVLIFDVNETLLDLAPLKASVGAALGGGADRAALWFATLLQYSLVATVADRYRNFDEIGVACLQMVARSLGIAMGEAEARGHLAPMGSLPPHPDVVPALTRLKAAGVRLATLTNSSREALARGLRGAGLDGLIDHPMSVEDVGLYKPHAHVYRWAARRLGVEVGGCMLVAAHGWDVAGASWAGMRAAFVGRPGQARFPLGPEVEREVPSLAELAGALLDGGDPA